MEFLNKVQLRGYVGNVNVQKVGEQTHTRFSVCTNYCYKSKDMVAVVDTTWHLVCSWDAAAATLKRGDAVDVTGRIRMQRYVDSDGLDRTACEIVANSIKVLDLGDERRLAFEE